MRAMNILEALELSKALGVLLPIVMLCQACLTNVSH